MHRGYWLVVSVIFGLFSITNTGAVEGSFSLVPICQIQGSGLTSPYAGQVIQTQGIVTADLDETSHKGFYIQVENCDANPGTSDGVFVYLGEKNDTITEGDFVQINGTVVEDYGFTQVESSDVQILSSNNPLPTPIELQPPFDNATARNYFETLESMLVHISLARVVGPTDSQGDTWVIRSDLGLDRVFQGDPAGTGEIVNISDEGLFEIQPPAIVGDQLQGLKGVLGFSQGIYPVFLTAPPTHIPALSNLNGNENLSQPDFTFGSFNLDNLFDVVDDPFTNDPILSSTEYHRKLEKLALSIHHMGEPTFLAIQEAENDIVLNHLLARTEIEADYEVLWLDGPDTRGIDVALLYRLDQVTLLGYEQHQGCTTLVDGLGPDGDRNVTNPVNTITCDTNEDGILDGNRLFSRPPLVAALEVAIPDRKPLQIWVIANHFKSKREDTSTQAYTLPRRIQQAQFVAELVDTIEANHPGFAVVVLGDLNDYPNSEPLAVLQQAGLWNAMLSAEHSTRYTYIYQGISQVLDYILVNAALATNWVDVQVVHINADYPFIYRGFDGIFYRSSDHDPVLANYKFLPYRVNLPLLNR